MISAPLNATARDFPTWLNKVGMRSKLGIVGFIGLLAFLIAGYFLIRDEARESTLTKWQTVNERSDSERSAQIIERRGDGVEREKEVSFEELERTAITHPDPEERIEAVQKLAGSRSRQEVITVLLQALKDKEAEVREAALESLDELEALSWETLSQVALNDPAPSLRARAIELLEEKREKGRPTVDLLRRIARMDTDEEVRQAARDLLEEIENGQ